MNINSDITQRIVIEPLALEWSTTAVTGLQQALLEQDGAARTTRLLRCEPATKLSPQYTGEEIFVLDGAISDGSTIYQKGSYLKNLPASSHGLNSATGCTLLVKSGHLDLDDTQSAIIDTIHAGWFAGLVDGLTVLPLAEFATQHTALVHWAPGTQFNAHRHFGGEEIYVLDGVFEDEQGAYPSGTWMRSPHLSAHRPYSRQGCTILVKTGHLIPTAATHDTR